MKHIKILVKVRFTTSIVVHVVHFEERRLLKGGACSDLGVNRAALIRGHRLFRSECQRCFVNLEKCPYSEFFWSVFSHIWTEYEEIIRISPYSVRMLENTDQNNSGYGPFSRSVCLLTLFSVEIIYNLVKNIKKY